MQIGATKWSSVELDVFLTLLLLYIQTFRRLLESMFVTRYSNRQMHIIHYILGLYFYTAVGPTAMISLVNTSECTINYTCMGRLILSIELVQYVETGTTSKL